MTRAPGKTAIVMGAGLAGIAAAVKLAEAGVRVTLLETLRRLGGRASSHDDPATGQTIDNCQHVLMGCCTNLLDLYGRLGVAEHVRWHPDLFFADKQGHVDVMRASSLPAPLHLAGAMLRFKTLGVRDKIAISRAMLAMMRMNVEERSRLTHITFGDWLRRHHQTQAAIDRFWSVVVVSALNQTVERAAATYAIQVFQDGFLSHPRAFVMGTSAVPLRELYDPATQVVEAAGGQVRFGTSVERLHIHDAQITGVELENGEVLTADVYISALPFDRLAKALPTSRAAHSLDARFAGLDQFRHSPIIGIHLWFDRRVLELPHLIFVDSPLQWVFDKTPPPELAATGGQYLHGVISAADEWVDKPADQIVAMAVRELRAYMPALNEAKLVRGKAIKEKRATFSPEPGIESHRPPATAPAGGVANLLLAGDWTATGWPATMEGAVRSGYRAAGATLAHDANALIDDLPASEIYRFVAAAGRRRSSWSAAAADIKR